MKMKKTCGIYFISSDNLLLIGHPTNAPMTVWSIPKGLQDPGETLIQSAIREFKEETRILISPMCLKPLNPIPYPNGAKELNAFVFKTYLKHTEYLPKCDHMVYQNDKPPFPEVDIYRWVTIDEAEKLLHHVQVKHLNYIKLLYNL